MATTTARMWLDITRPDRTRHLYPLGEHERPVDAAVLIDAALADQRVPAEDVRNPDDWQVAVHLLHGDEQLPDVLLERCTVHGPTEG